MLFEPCFDTKLKKNKRKNKAMNSVFESGSTHRRLTPKHTIYMAKKIHKGRVSTPQQRYTAGIVYERKSHTTQRDFWEERGMVEC